MKGAIQVFAMLVAMPPSEKDEEIRMGGKGTKTTFKGFDVDD